MLVSLGLVLMKVAGLIPWSSASKWKSIASHMYRFQVKLTFIISIAVYCSIIIINITQIKRTMKLLWRLTGISISFLQIILLSTNSDVLKKYFIEPLNLDPSNSNLRRNFNIKAKSLYLLYALLFILIVINSIMLSKVNKSSIKINELLASPGFINIAALILVRIYYYSVLTEIAVVAFSYDFLVMYIFLHIQVYMDHLKSKIEDIKFGLQFSSERNSRDYHVSTKCAVKNCILLHQHIISLVHVANQILSRGMLTQLCKIIAMFLATCELSKRVSNVSVGIEVFLMFRISMMTLLTFCLLAQSITDQGTALADACLGKLWDSVAEVLPPGQSGERRNLQVMAERCLLPLHITAGPCCVLSVATFTKIFLLSNVYQVMISLRQYSNVEGFSNEETEIGFSVW